MYGSVIRSKGMVKAQRLHSDFNPDDLDDEHPQHSAMVALADNTHIMLADSSAVVMHR